MTDPEGWSKGICLKCGRRIWVEQGCASLCEGCDVDDELEDDEEDDELEEGYQPEAVN